MTLAVAVKVNAGIVFAADSASTIFDTSGNVANVYFNANKVFNLYKGLPLAAVVWGNGSIGRYSISAVAKDFRCALKAPNSGYAIDPASFSVADIADKFKRFVFDERYMIEYADPALRPYIGFWIGGFSSNEDFGEVYGLQVNNGVLEGPTLTVAKDINTVLFNGQPEAPIRLILGHGILLQNVLETDLGLDPAEATRYVSVIESKLVQPFLYDSMPLQDAVDLADYLVDMTIKYTRFMPGAQTVGGPIEIATMTKHEQFKWVQRKYYFSTELNPATDNI